MVNDVLIAEEIGIIAKLTERNSGVIKLCIADGGGKNLTDIIDVGTQF